MGRSKQPAGSRCNSPRPGRRPAEASSAPARGRPSSRPGVRAYLSVSAETGVTSVVASAGLVGLKRSRAGGRSRTRHVLINGVNHDRVLLDFSSPLQTFGPHSGRWRRVFRSLKTTYRRSIREVLARVPIFAPRVGELASERWKHAVWFEVFRQKAVAVDKAVRATSEYSGASRTNGGGPTPCTGVSTSGRAGWGIDRTERGPSIWSSMILHLYQHTRTASSAIPLLHGRLNHRERAGGLNEFVADRGFRRDPTRSWCSN